MAGIDELQPGPTIGARGITFEHRIAITALATAIAVLAIASVMFIFQQWSAERADHFHSRKILTEVTARQIAPDLARGDLAGVRRQLDNLKAAPGVTDVVVEDAAGAERIRLRPSPTLHPASGAPVVTHAAISQDGRALGQLTMTSEPGDFTNRLLRYVAVCGALFCAAVFIAVAMGRWLASRLVKPVNRLSRAMLDVAESGDYSGRLPSWTQDEFGQLTDSFNSLLTQLEANDRALHRAMSDLVEARDAAQTANVLKSQFLANMSHEIRTPLNGVLAMAEIMALGELPPNQRDRVEVIRRSGEDLLTVLNDILDLSKIEAGRMELDEGELSADQLERKLVQTFAPVAAAKKNLSFEVKVRPAALGQRRGDLARVSQILGYLVSNAIKFTGEGKVRVEIDGYGPDGAEGLRLMVVDTGIGIAADQLPQLFQKFNQADNSNTRRFGGAGLGLTISRELALLMHGRIEVESVQGEGSTFTVMLPLPRLAFAPFNAPAPKALSGRPLRVLAAEDIPTNQLVLRTILQAFGVELEMADNGLMALEAWRARKFDLILMDIQMPVMDGLSAVRAIRAEEAASDRPRTPIIAVSANAMPHHIRSYLECGMDAHVAKPIELSKLHEAIERVAPVLSPPPAN